METKLSFTENRIDFVEGKNAGDLGEIFAHKLVGGELVRTSYDILGADDYRYEVKTLNEKSATLKRNASKSTPNAWAFEYASQTCRELAENLVGGRFDRLLIVKTEEMVDHYKVKEVYWMDGEDAVQYILDSAMWKKEGEFGKLRLASNPTSTRSGGQTQRHKTLRENGHEI